LGHVAYGINLRNALAARDDLEPVWIEVPFAPGAFGRLPGIGKNWTLRGSLRAWSRIRDELRNGPLDALFIHTQTISIFAGSFMERIPTLLSLDATPMNLDELAGPYAHRVGSRRIESLKRAAHVRVMRRAKRYTTWSQWAKDSLVRDYGVDGSKVTVVHPGTTISNFPPPSARAPRDDRPLQVLFVGGDFERKGGDLLLDVYHRRLRGICELHLVTGSDVGEEIGVHVYRGLKPHSPELLRLYADADVFALPTRGDCLAVVLGEAMAACLPIITTSVGAHAEAVEDGASGFVIAVDDDEALGARLEQLARDRALTHRMGMRSRAIGEARFDMGKGANEIGDILVRIATEGKSQERARDAVPARKEPA
jgi:glycosyltransferase involved in cell wall biosynthesis